MAYECSKCKKVFTRKYTRDRHFKKHAEKQDSSKKESFTCAFCKEKNIDKQFDDKKLLVQHVDENHLDSLSYKMIKSAFNGKAARFSKKLVTLLPLEVFVSDHRNLEEILQVILLQLSKFQVIKAALIVTADYRIPSVVQSTSAAESNENEDDEELLLAEERDNFSLRTKREIFSVNETNKSATKKVRNLLKLLLEREQDLLMRGSGWQFESLLSCDIEIVSHNSI